LWTVNVSPPFLPKWKEIDVGVGVCRITVIGEPPGRASAPPRITFYVKDGGDAERGNPLRADEARRCAEGLIVGDVVRLVGDLGPERGKATRQEVIVTEEVICRWQAERLSCRAKESEFCHDGRSSAAFLGEHLMAGDETFDGETVVCDACKVGEVGPSFEEEGLDSVPCPTSHDAQLGVVA
jgi:hypothetical protein